MRIAETSGCTAVRRMAPLSIVRSVWCKVFDLYNDTKGSDPNLRSFFNAVEERVLMLHTVASNTVLPVIMKLQPQMSIVNDIACKSLDWLETTFPSLQVPAGQVIAITMDKMHGARAVVRVAATSTISCVQSTVEHAMDKVIHTDHHLSPVMERAMTVAEGGLDQALTISEALVEHMLPPAEEENEEAVNSVQGFESTAHSYPVRLQSVRTKLCRRTYMVLQKLCRSHSPALTLKPLACSVAQYLKDQAATVILFMSQMYTLKGSSPQHIDSEGFYLFTGSQVQWQESPTWRLKKPKGPDGDCMSCEACGADGYNTKCCTSP